MIVNGSSSCAPFKVAVSVLRSSIAPLPALDAAVLTCTDAQKDITALHYCMVCLSGWASPKHMQDQFLPIRIVSFVRAAAVDGIS